MCLANEILAQGNEMVYLDTFYFEDEILYSKPKFEGLPEYARVPISTWTEAICQTGELYCRSENKALAEVILTNVTGIIWENVIRKDAALITFQTKKICEMQHYFKSEITVMKENHVMFVCNCTHYMK